MPTGRASRSLWQAPNELAVASLESHQGKTLIGLTGNIACGKSTVLSQLAGLGAYTIDADRLIHSILLKDGPAYKPVIEEFGSSIVLPDGEIDRRSLGKIVFSDPSRLRRLEEIEHPIVRTLIESAIVSASQRIVILDAIKLIEAGWADKCAQVWVVTCLPEQQIERLIETRGYSEEEARMRVAAQPPQEEKMSRADVVIDNSGTRRQTQAQVISAWQSLISGLLLA